jgi:hypothetical protein
MLAQREIATAGEVFQLALAICRRRLDNRHAQFASTIFNIGRLRQCDGDPDVVLEAFMQAESIAAQRLPMTHPLLAAIHESINAIQRRDLADRLCVQKAQQPRQ